MTKGLLCIPVFVFLHVEGVSYFCLYSLLGAILAPSSYIYFSLLIKKTCDFVKVTCGCRFYHHKVTA